MKLSLSTDFGSEAHWRRLIEFASRFEVDRLVYWGDFTRTNRFLAPLLYPDYPGLVADHERAEIEAVRASMLRCCELTKAAGMELWFVYQVLSVPSAERLRATLPDMFNAEGEPDMSGTLVYQLLRDQLQELFALAPDLDGIEMWVMEGATIRIANLAHQDVSNDVVCERIVDCVYECVESAGQRLIQDLHTSGGDTTTLRGLAAAAARHPRIIVSGDNVIGDYHLDLPFNDYLVRAAATNPVQVNFDLNGEYWGRNFVPTCGLSQYVAHVDAARRLGCAYVNGRVATGHDLWSPHGNVLPSRQAAYPALAAVGAADPVPGDLELTCTDTLGAFNAELFCQRVRSADAAPREVLRGFLQRELGAAGGALDGLTDSFLQLEDVLRNIFYVDTNYFAGQSVIPNDKLTRVYAIAAHLTAPTGTPFPTDEAMRITAGSGHPIAFRGWPTPVGHVSAGIGAMLAAKREAVAGAERLLDQVQAAGAELDPEPREFLINQFEDLVLVARAFRFTLEALAHHYHRQAGVEQDGVPDVAGLAASVDGMRTVRDQWARRYPGGRYLIAERLDDWLQVVARGGG